MFTPIKLVFQVVKSIPSDQTPWDAAKRELWEELGISPQQITQIRKITPLYIPPSHFWVDCFLAYSNAKTELNLDQNEVKEVISVSLLNLSISKKVLQIS